MEKKKIIVIGVIIVVLLIVVLLVWSGIKKGGGVETPLTGEIGGNGEEVTVPGDVADVYEPAKAVKPASSGINSALHDDFKAVFDSVFGGSKLVSASSEKVWEDFEYIVKTPIKEQDAEDIRSSLEEKGYETVSSSAKADKYSYTFSKEISGKEYDSIQMTIWLEAAREALLQKITITVYKPSS